MSEGTTLDQQQADVLAGRICAAAGLSAQSECELLTLIGEFDAAEAVRWWAGVKSLAHWLSWCCSMSPGTAREHVRVARALRVMPTVRSAFAAGRLSYSKVREVTRVVDVVDEARLCELALTATASQLARMIAGYRRSAGSRIAAERSRSVTWTERDEGMVDFRIRLPADEAAVLIAALRTAKDQFGAPTPAGCHDPAASPDGPVDPTPTYSSADAVLDVARGFLATAPEDRSGEDRHLVVVHVAAEHLADPEASGTDHSAPTDQRVPAGTHAPLDPTCHIQGVGGIEAATAQRLACDADVIGAVIGHDGEVLSLGRARRLVSRAQRRALMIRDSSCQFPGCHQTRHLKAHHLVPWSRGGPTDLSNLILLCQFHHTAVHEGGMAIVRAAAPTPGRRWDALMPDGSAHRDWYAAEALAGMLAQHSVEQVTVLHSVDGFDHPAARRIRPGWRGERFDLHRCVEALVHLQLDGDESEAA